MLSLRINRGDKMKKYLIAIIGLLIIGVSFAGCRHIGAYLYGDEFYGEYYYETDSVDDYLYLPYNDTFFNGGLWDQKEMIKCVKMMMYRAWNPVPIIILKPFSSLF